MAQQKSLKVVETIELVQNCQLDCDSNRISANKGGKTAHKPCQIIVNDS